MFYLFKKYYFCQEKDCEHSNKNQFMSDKERQDITSSNHLEVEQDHVLLEAFIAGNSYAYSLIYKKYINELFAYGVALNFEREAVKDAIQEVFYKLHLHKQRLKNVCNLKHYLLRILKNHLLNHYRSQVETNEINSNEITFSIHTTVLDELIDKEEQIQLRNRINKLLQVLTNRQREAIYLRFIQEMEYEEIGILLEMTPQASRKLVSRAIKRMREEDAAFFFLLLLYYM